MEGQTILAIITAVGGLTGLASFVGFLFYVQPTRRKMKAEAEQIEADADNKKIDGANRTLDGAFGLLAKVQEQLNKTEIKVDELECKNREYKTLLLNAMRRIDYLMRGIKALIEQVKSLNGKPIWEPDDSFHLEIEEHDA